jgi:hypothetical protein
LTLDSVKVVKEGSKYGVHLEKMVAPKPRLVCGEPCLAQEFVCLRASTRAEVVRLDEKVSGMKADGRVLLRYDVTKAGDMRVYNLACIA